MKFVKIQKLAFLLGWFIGTISELQEWKNLVYRIVHLVKVRK